MIENLSTKTKLILAAIGGVLLLIYSSMFIVFQTEQVLVLQFQKAKRVIKEPGLHFKLPFIQDIRRYDNRILNHNLEPREIIAADQKRVIVDAYVKYRIVDPLSFKQTVENELIMSDRLSAFLDAKLREVVGSVKLTDLLTEERAAIMGKIKSNVNDKVNSFGIEVTDVRIRRADLPKENSQAIFSRMQTEREKEARDIRSRGEKEKIKTISEADKKVKITIAEADRDASRLKGSGDATASKIFADAFTRDPEFYGFYRSMDAYRKAMKAGDTRLVLSPDSEFLKFFSDTTPRKE